MSEDTCGGGEVTAGVGAAAVVDPGVVTGVSIGVDIGASAGVGVGAAASVDPELVHPYKTTIATSRAKQKTVASFCMVEPTIF